MKVLALDQSSRNTAFAIMEDGKLLDYGLIRTKLSKRVNKVKIEEASHLITITMPEDDYNTTLLRISYICDVVKKIIKEIKPTRVAFEDIYISKAFNPMTKRMDYSQANISGFRSLGRLQGQLSRILWEMKMPYDIILEQTWITAFGTYNNNIKRDERKKDIMDKINSMFGLDITVDDISDAIGIAFYVSQAQI